MLNASTELEVTAAVVKQVCLPAYVMRCYGKVCCVVRIYRKWMDVFSHRF
jgi:hypothetical protein